MREILERQINESSSCEVKLEGKIKIKTGKVRWMSKDKNFIRKLISIKRPDIVIDGSNCIIEVEICNEIDTDMALFYISKSARNVHFKNLKIYVHIENTENTERIFYGIYNNSMDLNIDNCVIDISSKNQMNIIGIYNRGDKETNLSTCADNLVISNSSIKAKCCAEVFTKESNIYGIYNHLANSISVQNTNLYVINNGTNWKQRAFGIYTTGRFGRFVGNNIKANGSHPRGREKEKAYTCAFFNEGLYSIISSNNIIGEWGGKCVGLKNNGAYAEVVSNKILSTHTICGRCIENYATRCNFGNNMIISTSRNAILIKNCGGESVINNNYLEVLLPPETCVSGCGIYSIGDISNDNIISQNIIKNMLDCALYIKNGCGIIKDNVVISPYRKCKECIVDADDEIKQKFEEENIKSIYEEK